MLQEIRLCFANKLAGYDAVQTGYVGTNIAERYPSSIFSVYSRYHNSGFHIPNDILMVNQSYTEDHFQHKDVYSMLT